MSKLITVTLPEEQWEATIKAIEVVCQQADRIAELEKECHWAKDQWDKDRICFKARIAELEKSTMAWYEAGKFVSPQLKELSDEEITEVLNDENIAEYHQGNWLVLPYAFARAILRKAQEK